VTSDQLSLDDLPSGPTARNTDPETAKMAGAAQTPAKMGAGRRKVLMCLFRWPSGLSDFDYLPRCGMIQTSAGKRRVELQRAGLVEQVPGEYGTSPSGSKVALWRLTHEGRNLAVRLDMEQSLDG